ncbi:MAG: alpha/beta fold hydrolase [Rhodospirillaceae bacterium]|jgi:3-oxoadipate enol-lactonase|nr:alpha/beta fold hydrolase [Rhodospirillaceae bacterium]MBT5811753.1 alpha/beta fold hydrolase [Rhodospirillaceae bacterium]
MPRITLNGIGHHYRLEGPEDAPVLTLAHAQGFTLDSWSVQIAHFRDRYRVLAPDLRGHGGTDMAGAPYLIEDIALDIVALLDALGIERTHYAGASLGGMAGFALALDHAERLRSVAFVTTQGVLPQVSIDGQRTATAVMRKDGADARVDAVLERYLRKGYREDDPESYAELRRQFTTNPVEGYAEAGDAIFAMNFDDRIGDIHLPTMVIAGSDDIATTPERMTLYRDGVPGAGMDIIPNTGHMPYVEDADAFNKVLAGFLDSLPRT